jgi:hypothetical protein
MQNKELENGQQKKYGYGYSTADSIGVFRQGVECLECPFDVGDVGEVLKRATGRA